MLRLVRHVRRKNTRCPWWFDHRGGCFAILALLLALAWPPSLQAQVTTSGQECTVNVTCGTSSGGTFNLATQTPALNFSQTSGVTTFIFGVSPSVSIKLAITNDTANACNGSFVVSIASAAQKNTSSLNNTPQNWQYVLLQSPTGGLATLINVNIPASSTLYVTSTAISANVVAIQIVNTLGTCSSTTIDATAVLTNVAVTSPLVSISNGSSGSGATSNVQGVTAAGTNGTPVLPVEVGVLQPATNGNSASNGIDVSSVSSTPISSGQTGVINFGNPPAPTNSTERGFFFGAPFLLGGGATGPGGPWTCVTAVAACPGNPQLLTTTNVNAVNTVTYSSNGASQSTVAGIFVDVAQSTIRQSISGAGANPAFPSNTLAGSTSFAFIDEQCSSPCTPLTPTVTDTQGLSYSLIKANITGNNVGATQTHGVFVYAAGPTTAAADTLTFANTNTIVLDGASELSGISAAALNQPLTAPLGDAIGRQAIVQDAIGANQLVGNVTLSTNTTTVLTNFSSATSINNIATRFYISDVQINTTTAGTATTIQLVAGSGANCVTGQTNLSSITYANTTVGLQTFTFRTPLSAPVGNSVCAKQAGTTPGTSVVEAHGFVAP